FQNLVRRRRVCLVENYKRAPEQIKVQRQACETRNVDEQCPFAKELVRPRVLIWKICAQRANVYWIDVSLREFGYQPSPNEAICAKHDNWCALVHLHATPHDLLSLQHSSNRCIHLGFACSNTPRMKFAR